MCFLKYLNHSFIANCGIKLIPVWNSAVSNDMCILCTYLNKIYVYRLFGIWIVYTFYLELSVKAVKLNFIAIQFQLDRCHLNNHLCLSISVCLYGCVCVCAFGCKSSFMQMFSLLVSLSVSLHHVNRIDLIFKQLHYLDTCNYPLRPNGKWIWDAYLFYKI